MAEKIKIELDSKYAEHLELLKQVIPSSTGEQVTDNGIMVETLIDSFMGFLQEQMGGHEHSHDGGCCGDGEKKSEHKHGGGCCSN